MSDGSLRRFIREIHRRSLWQVLGIYLLGSWAVLGGMGTLMDTLALPGWFPSVALALLIVGLPIVLATAFVQEGGPGVEAEQAADSNAAETAQGRTQVAMRASRLLTWRHAFLAGLAALVLEGGAVAGWLLIGDGPSPDVDPAIAVPPFRVQGEEMDLWREGMVDALSLYLDGVAGLRAIDPRTLMSRFRGRAGSGGALDLATTLAVAEQAGAQYALIGTGLSAGGQVRFTAELYAVDTPTPLNRLESAGDAADVLALVDRLGAETVFALADTGLELVPGIEIASGMTSSARALTAYLEGEALYRAGECTDAVVVLERAILEDPTFAMAHYRLALACSWGGPCFDRVTAYLLESLRLGLPERKSLPAQAWVAISDVSLAKLDALREGVLRYPEDPEVLQFLGENYYHLGEAAALEDWQAESERIFSRVIELDPGFAAVYQHPIQIAFLRGDSARAAALIEAAGAAEPDGSLDRFHRTLFGLAFGNLEHPDSVRAGVDSLLSLERNPVEYLGYPGFSPAAFEIESRASQADRDAGFFCIERSLGPGDWSGFLSRASDPSRDPEDRLYCLYAAHASGLPVPTDSLEATLLPLTDRPWAPGESANTPDLWRGAYAAERGQWNDYETSLDRLHEAERQFRIAGDSTATTAYESSVAALTAYGEWKRGRPDEAIAQLEALPLRYRGPVQRWWLGELYLEGDRPRDAARLFDTYTISLRWSHSLYQLGIAYEGMGQMTKAEETYEEFIVAWAQADPELQPLVERAKARLAAISGR